MKQVNRKLVYPFLVILLFIIGFIMLSNFKSDPRCKPCFKYFDYVEHTSEQLVIKNGNKEITDIKPWEGVSSIPSAQADDRMTISGASIVDRDEVWVSYKINGVLRKDYAKLHFVT